MPDSGETLYEAYQLVEKGDLAQARALIEPLLDSDPTNEDALWIYAHAAEDKEAGQNALRRLSRLNPDYPGLQTLLADTGVVTTRARTSTPVVDEPILEPDLSESVSPNYAYDIDSDLDDIDAELAEDESGRSGRSFLYLILAGLVVVVIVLLLLNAAANSNTPPQVADNATQTSESITSEPTSEEMVPIQPESTVADMTTEEPTPTMESMPVDVTDVEATDEAIEPTTAAQNVDESMSGEFASIEALLVDQALAEDGIVMSQTALGDTLMINICSLPGPDATPHIREVFETLGQEPEETLAGAAAIGVGLTDCATNTLFRTVGVSTSDARDFANGTLDSREFEARWRPF